MIKNYNPLLCHLFIFYKLYSIGCFIKCAEFEILFRKTKNKRKWLHMAYLFTVSSQFTYETQNPSLSTCTQSAYMYALFEITYTSVARCRQSHSRFQPGVVELCVVCWRIPWILRKPQQEKITRAKIARSWRPFLIAMQGVITRSGNFLWSNASVGTSLHSAETRSCQSSILSNSATTEWISSLGTDLH